MGQGGIKGTECADQEMRTSLLPVSTKGFLKPEGENALIFTEQFVCLGYNVRHRKQSLSFYPRKMNCVRI